MEYSKGEALMAGLTTSRGGGTQANGHLPIGIGIFQYLTSCTSTHAYHLLTSAGYSSFSSTEPRPGSSEGVILLYLSHDS